MKILLTGAAGQLGQALRQQVPAGASRGGADRHQPQRRSRRLLQVSTDFVFNRQQGSPYRPEQARDPLGAYRRTTTDYPTPAQRPGCWRPPRRD